MISVAEARAKTLALVAPKGVEIVPLTEASGRVLATDAVAKRAQPPFAASAMDGYAVRAEDAQPGAVLTVIGEAAAGHAFDGVVASGQAARIFTGAPIPEGATRVVIQEDVTANGTSITLSNRLEKNHFIRAAGGDFAVGDTLSAPRVLSPADLALLASMNLAEVPVTCKPSVAIIATGDELVMPGDAPADDQIIASNCFGLHAMITAAGGLPRLLPIARDTESSLRMAFEMAQGCDLIVTIGGASVGDHDLVGQVAAELGLERAFYKIAMRPGKPLMAGHLGGVAMLGLPGNPVSAMVCGQLFMLPMIRKMLGLPTPDPVLKHAKLTAPLSQNGSREHYMRARLTADGIAAFDRQDSSLLTVLADANALIVRPIDDPARAIGEDVSYLPL
ncbi:gephyrin-like molybdotransferase Glp [Cognatishimia sp. MH4019]|uniref:molybdopterin molybdotransferase MoeA n=1 Tax=Cognatishimia sp. MH4019 TaxID=2854030 RepID=UPI001CD48326|nr:gephyrin-like molybdotransferase Glp [Cognatishimia sp. MH4019]